MVKDDPSPAELLERMVAFGKRLFAVPKDAITEAEAKRPKRAERAVVRRRPKEPGT